MLPAYIAAGVIEPVRSLGLVPHFYRTGTDLLYSVPDLVAELHRSGATAVIVLHPMGRQQELDGLVAACRERGALLIEDCAQGLFSEGIGTRGDVALYSLTKFLGTVDGAIVVSRGALPAENACARPVSAWIAGAWLRAHLLANRCLHAASRPWVCDALLHVSGFLHERYYALSGSEYRAFPPSQETLEAVARLDAQRLVAQRRRNVQQLYERLSSPALRLVYPEDRPGWVPLAVPAFAAHRAGVQARARRAGVFLATLCQRWDHLPAGADHSAERYYLDHHVLIPVNEHIDDRRMSDVVKVLNEI